MRVISWFLFVLFILSTLHGSVSAAKKSYVVYLGRHSVASGAPSSTHVDHITQSHHDLLGSCMKSKERAKEAIFYSYTSYINGFAATLEDDEVHQVSKRPEVLSVFPNEVSELHTTRSWEFLGVERDNGYVPSDSIWRKARYGEDVIIGTLDTGVWPESESFKDDEMGPIPSRWKGYCETADGVKCNKKLIGARYFNKGYEAAIGRPLNSSDNTARDTDGHGTHTLSTAGGRFVPGANLLGSANGTAKGGSPRARVSSYKVCWPSCYDADILAAFDAAIQDGVDIISVSLGFSNMNRPYFTDSISIGSFHAVRQGILVVCSAGNVGPSPSSVRNVVPWILTVAASTLDRDFPSYVTLGDNRHFKSYNTNSLKAGSQQYYPLVASEDVKAANATISDAQVCFPGSLDPSKVKGKIVYCVRGIVSDVEKSFVVAESGGVGMILAGQFITSTITPQPFFLPTSVISAMDGLSILHYIYNTKSPMAYISGSTQIGDVPAPIMASFSSVGPNSLTPEILKPDITAPGVRILAAYTEAITPSSTPGSERSLAYNIISGTSMSCPHVSGIAGLLKTMYPHWSPAAIKSAIMTTARTRSNIPRQPIVDSSLGQANPMNYGAGHVWPNSAMNPGLVYDLNTTDYLKFLCSIGYNQTQLSPFIEDEPFQCPTKNVSLFDLNYPSITIPNLLGNVTLTRTLKNVGTPGSYRVRVKAPNGISVKVEPSVLRFNKINEEKSFKVTMKANARFFGYVFGGLTWSDGTHHVRSPISVRMAPIQA